jgi:hypothetical protein
MARLEWVKVRLDNWARWVVQREAGGSGYPKQSAFSRAAGSSSTTESMIPVDDIDAGKTHDAIARLRQDNHPLWLAVQCHYVGRPWDRPSRRRPLSTLEVAEVLGVTPRWVQLRLEQADQALTQLLSRTERA